MLPVYTYFLREFILGFEKALKMISEFHHVTMKCFNTCKLLQAECEFPI